MAQLRYTALRRVITRATSPLIVTLTARQFLQGSYAMLSVIDRVELVQVQQFGQLARIDAVALVPNFQQSIFSRITHQHFGDVGFEQIVQPRRASSFFKGHPQTSTKSVINSRDRKSV